MSVCRTVRFFTVGAGSEKPSSFFASKKSSANADSVLTLSPVALFILTLSCRVGLSSMSPSSLDCLIPSSEISKSCIPPSTMKKSSFPRSQLFCTEMRFSFSAFRFFDLKKALLIPRSIPAKTPAIPESMPRQIFAKTPVPSEKKYTI